MNNRERGKNKIIDAVKWIYRWGWSIPSVIDALIEPGRSGFTNKLIQKGFASYENNTPMGSKIITLTSLGVEMATLNIQEEREWTRKNYPKKDPCRLFNTQNFALELTTQFAIVDKLVTGEAIDYMAPRQFNEDMFALGFKQPNAILIMKDMSVIAVEVDRRPAKEIHRNRAIIATVNALSSKPSESEKYKPMHYDGFLFMSPSKAMLNRYQREMTPGREVPTYENIDGKWIAAGFFVMPDLKDKFHFQIIKERYW